MRPEYACILAKQLEIVVLVNEQVHAKMCPKRRLRQPCVSTQSDPSQCCELNGCLRPHGLFIRTVKNLIGLDGCIV